MSKNYTVKEVAGIFRRSVCTIYRWIDEGKIIKKIIKVGDGYLISENEVQRILKEKTINIKP